MRFSKFLYEKVMMHAVLKPDINNQRVGKWFTSVFYLLKRIIRFEKDFEFYPLRVLCKMQAFKQNTDFASVAFISFIALEIKCIFITHFLLGK